MPITATITFTCPVAGCPNNVTPVQIVASVQPFQRIEVTPLFGWHALLAVSSLSATDAPSVTGDVYCPRHQFQV